MCNYSEYIEERGFKKGFEQGFKEGFEQGFKEAVESDMLVLIQNVMESLHVSATEAMNALQVPEADRSKYMERLSESQ